MKEDVVQDLLDKLEGKRAKIIMKRRYCSGQDSWPNPIHCRFSYKRHAKDTICDQEKTLMGKSEGQNCDNWTGHGRGDEEYVDFKLKKVLPPPP